MPVSWAMLVAPPLIPTYASAFFLALYFASKRVICRKLAVTFLLIATMMWFPIALIALGIVPMPQMPPR
jgi:hypothetical protein